MSKKVVIGFSGGLDTSYCVKYFRDELNYEVHSIVVNTGGQLADHPGAEHELVGYDLRIRRGLLDGRDKIL